MKSSRTPLSEKRKATQLNALAAPILETIALQYVSNKVLLIHPSSHYGKLLVAGLLNAPPCDLFYHAMGVEDVNLAQFLIGFSNSLSDQAAAFGSDTLGAINQKIVDAKLLAQIFGRDLNRLNADHYLLVLDDYDRADSVVEIQIFMEALLDFLPAQCHLLFSSRTLPRLPWVGLVARRQAVVLRDARVMPVGFYA